MSFSLPVDPSKWREDVDFASQLASTSASSMAIFAGPSWSEVRDELFTRAVTAPRIPTNTPSAARASPANDEIDLVRILDNNTIELTRRYNPPFLITLNATSPQDLITDLGPPSAIYRKSDHRLNIHRAARASSGGDGDDSDPEDLPSEDDDECSDMSSSAGGECFYNYFNHGFDVFVSAHRSASHPVATKLIIHGNVPGSYEFQRYRRCRWVIDLQGTAPNNAANGSNGASTGKPTKLTRPLKIHSEEGFDEVKEKLKERFGEVGKPMPFSRGSDSPSSSCELLGGWEDGDAGMGKDGGGAGTTFGNTGEFLCPQSDG